MNEITNRDVERYMVGLLPAHDAVMKKMEAEAAHRPTDIAS